MPKIMVSNLTLNIHSNLLRVANIIDFCTEFILTVFCGGKSFSEKHAVAFLLFTDLGTYKNILIERPFRPILCRQRPILYHE